MCSARSFFCGVQGPEPESPVFVAKYGFLRFFEKALVKDFKYYIIIPKSYILYRARGRDGKGGFRYENY
jgi:hypothetical protein